MNTDSTQRSTTTPQLSLRYRDPVDLAVDLADFGDLDVSVQETELSPQEIQSAWWDEDDDEEIQRHAELGGSD